RAAYSGRLSSLAIVCLLGRGRTVSVATQTHAGESLSQPFWTGRAVGQVVEAAHYTPTAVGHQAYPLYLTGPPPYGVASRDVEMHAPGLGAVKRQAAVHLEEGEVGADEDGVIRGVLDVEFHRAASRIEDNRPRTKQPLTRFHWAPPSPGWIGCSTCSTRMPSP